MEIRGIGSSAATPGPREMRSFVRDVLGWGRSRWRASARRSSRLEGRRARGRAPCEEDSRQPSARAGSSSASSRQSRGAEALGHVRQLDGAVHRVLVEQQLDLLEHRGPLVGRHHGAVAAGEDEVEQPGAIEPLAEPKGGLLDSAEEPALSERRRDVVPLDRLASERLLAQPRHPRHPLVARVPDERHVAPGRRTRAISRRAGPWSNQWKAWAAVTTSALDAGSGMSSAPPSTTVAPGAAARRCAIISGSGSTAVTRWPSAASDRVSFPVPAPRSTTSRGVSPASHRTASSG